MHHTNLKQQEVTLKQLIHIGCVAKGAILPSKDSYIRRRMLIFVDKP